MKKRDEMIPGKRYRGYGFINEFKEFCFEPEDTGAHAGREKCIHSSDGLRVTETKNCVIIRVNLTKSPNKADYTFKLMNTFNRLSKFFRDYDI